MNTIHRALRAGRVQTGFSLVELMVALAISMFLVIGIIQLFVGSKQTYRFYDALSRLQENGRFALGLMAQDIRMAGYYGCSSAAVNIKNNLNTPTAYFWNFTQPIQGFESTAANTWAPTLDASILNPSTQGNADVITVRGVDGAGMAVLAHGGGVNDPRVTSGFASCDVAAISTCQAVSIFQVTGTAAAAAIAGNPGPPAVPSIPAGITLAHTATTPTCTNSAPGNAENNLGPVNYAGGEIAPVSTKSYYLRNGASGRLALWRRAGAMPSQEIVEGVERMQITYGVDTAPTGVPPRPTVARNYVAANAVTNWNNVVSVRVDLLLASLEDNVVTNPQSVVFPAATGVMVTVNDRRVRQGFSTTVAIRNRLP